jgi:hypothetical protein
MQPSPLRDSTPVERVVFPGAPSFAVDVKREDLAVPPPGPPFSKVRGVFAHVAKRPEPVIGVLDTVHSKAGWAVAYAVAALGLEKRVVNFYPLFKSEGPSPALREPQLASAALGAHLHPLPAGRSAILHHRARALLRTTYGDDGAYLMPNALKLEESVEETALEVGRTKTDDYDWIAVPISSGTIAAGVVRGLSRKHEAPRVILHAGYSRPEGAILEYVEKTARLVDSFLTIAVVDEGYAYADARPAPEWWPVPSSPFYDAKLVRWLDERRIAGRGLVWNIG